MKTDLFHLVSVNGVYSFNASWQNEVAGEGLCTAVPKRKMKISLISTAGM